MFSSHPLFRRFENELTVGEQKLEWTIQGKDFVFRPREADETIVWFFLGRADVGRNLLQVSKRGDHTFAAEQSMRNRHFWRWWMLENGEEYFLRKNYGILRAANHELVRFDFPFAFSNFEQAKGDEVEAFLKMLSSSDSDLESAKRWINTSNQQRVRQLFQLSGGSHNEFEALIQGSLVLSGEQETFFSMRDVMIMPGRVLLRYKVGGGPPHPVDKFFEILNRYFHLERTKQDWRGHDELGDPTDTPYRVYTSADPTQHEQLEAILNWRDFLRDKMPPGEIKTLLKI